MPSQPGPSKRWPHAASATLVEMLRYHAEKAPLGRNVETSEVGDTAAFLASDMASGITGETLYVDCGYGIMGS